MIRRILAMLLRTVAALDNRSPSNCCSDAIAASSAASVTDPTVAGRAHKDLFLGW